MLSVVPLFEPNYLQRTTKINFNLVKKGNWCERI